MKLASASSVWTPRRSPVVQRNTRRASELVAMVCFALGDYPYSPVARLEGAGLMVLPMGCRSDESSDDAPKETGAQARRAQESWRPRSIRENGLSQSTGEFP